MILTLVAFVVVLMVLVLAHELGHFTTAKLFGVKVDEFGLGFPPRIVSFTHGETRYSLNALPVGGFVKLAGEEDPKVPRRLAAKPARVRVTVLAAGSLMNAILPVLLFTIAFLVPQDVVVGQVVVQQVVADSPAALAGIRAGDIVLSINDKALRNNADLQRAIQLNLGDPITMQVKHQDSNLATIRLVPRWRPPAGQGAVGIQVKTDSPAIVSEHYPVWQAIPLGVRECIDTYVLFKNGIIGMFIGTAPAAVAGPIGIAQITGEVARAGFSPLLEFAAFLSINLAIVNILPLPALDGGRIAFVLIEKIRRKRVSPRVEGLVHMIGFAMLMALILLVTYQDIVRIVAGESLIP